MKRDLTPWRPGELVIYLAGSDAYVFVRLPVGASRNIKLHTDAAIRKALYSSWRAHIETKR